MKNLTFGVAIEAMKKGESVCRLGWNDKGMFLKLINQGEWIMPNTTIVNGKILPLLPFIGMKTADEKFVPWLASQTDMLANDWEIYEQDGKLG